MKVGDFEKFPLRVDGLKDVNMKVGDGLNEKNGLSALPYGLSAPLEAPRTKMEP